MEKELDLHLSLKKEEEIKTTSNTLYQILPISTDQSNILFPSSSPYQISPQSLESLVTKYTDYSKDILSLFNEIESLGGTNGLLEKLNTSADEGIKTEKNRKEFFGVNKVFEEPPIPFIKFLKESLCELMIIILLSAATLQVIIGVSISEEKKYGWIDGTSVFGAVFTVVFVESFTNWKKEKKFYELNKLRNSTTTFKTIRNGNKVNIKSEELLVGDIIFISVGDIIPVDLFLLESNNMKIDESSLTGESHLISKDSYEICISRISNNKGQTTPIILSGTACIEGNGKAVVIAVGERSTKGKIQRMVDNSKEEKTTPLQNKLEILAKRIGIFAFSAGIFSFVCLCSRLTLIYLSDYNQYKINLHQNHTHDKAHIRIAHPKHYLISRILENVMIASVVITVSLPEGLPMAIALTLAFSLKRLMDKNNFVRKMHSCETMGGANYILTDKTGTLTTNELSVVKIINIEKEFELCEDINNNIDDNINGIEIRETRDKYFNNEIYWELLRNAISLNINGHINYLDEPNINGDIEECSSKNKTDNALIKFLYRIKSPISEIEKKYQNAKKKQIPFDSNKKRMTTFIKMNDNKFRLYTKGGAEYISKYCKYYINSETGEKIELNNDTLKILESKIEKCNNDMLRTIYICYKEINEEDFENKNENIDTNNLILLAVFGIRDTIRKGVKEAVLKCKEASVNVIMVTGDNIKTAISIAKSSNIIEENDINLPINSNSINNNEVLLSNPPIEINGDTFYEIIEGIYCSTCDKSITECTCPKTNAEAELISKKNKMALPPIKNDKIRNLKNFKKIIKNLKVMARSKPIHKYALVLGLIELNYIVAVTGDGTNDAPALSKSDVGFSMLNGTDIAKNSSDIILMDNNFTSIVTAIKYGRNVIDNLRKFIQFQMVINITICALVITCACIGSQTPINTIQILWIDLIMDCLATLSLATEVPHDGLLKRKPTNRNENLITKNMFKHSICQAIAQYIILMTIYLFGPRFINEQNLTKIAESKTLLNCYGILPGGIRDTSKILYGIQTYWYNNIKINKEAVEKGLCGEYADYHNLSQAFRLYNRREGGPVQLTMIFHIYVIYTLFNQLNCRIIDDNKNVFARIKYNLLFLVIEAFEFSMQFMIIEYWNYIFKSSRNGLTINQWGLCFLFGSLSLIIDFILKIKI